MLKKIYKKIFPDNYWHRFLKKECLNIKSVLDLGCGNNSPIQFTNVKYSVGVDNFSPYIKSSQEKSIHSQYIKSNLINLEIKDKTYDLVLCSEVIEHLKKEDGRNLIKKMNNIAIKKIIITTPNGFLEQAEFDGNSMQKHLSGWTIQELKKLGFKVYGINGLKFIRNKNGFIIYKPKYLWKFFSDITKPITYFFPKYACQLFTVKKL
jgi:ubiquinone/menaquinone biosynthesis C-methylase UbiE